MTTLNDIPEDAVGRDVHSQRPRMLEERPRAPKPRVWLALLVGAAAMPVGYLAALIAHAAFEFVYGPSPAGFYRGPEYWGATADAVRYCVWAVLFSIAVQGAFLAMALGPAAFSTHGICDRVGFRRGSFSAPAIFVLALGSIFASTAGGYAVRLFLHVPDEAFDHYRWTFYRTSWTLFIALFLASTVLPAVAEETLFRGYVQRRLLQRWPPWLAIAVTAVLFAAMHGSIYHAMVLVPGAIWLGIIAWRAGSIWPAVACHFAINADWFILMAIDVGSRREVATQLHWFVLSISLVAFLASVIIVIRTRRKIPADREVDG